MQGRWAARAKGIEVQLLLILFSEMGLKRYIVSLPSAASPTVQTRPPHRWQLLIVLSTLPSITLFIIYGTRAIPCCMFVKNFQCGRLAKIESLVFKLWFRESHWFSICHCLAFASVGQTGQRLSSQAFRLPFPALEKWEEKYLIRTTQQQQHSSPK